MIDDRVEDETRLEGPSQGTARDKVKGAGRGLETLYRNSYRMMLDLTALADGKANIMISINGICFTALALAGSFMSSRQPWLLLPIATFLLSSLASMVLAVLAARPQVARGNATPDDFMAARSDVLYFNNFPKVTQEQFVEAFENLAGDRKQLYRQMARTIHALGLTAARKYSRIGTSYTIFIAGLSASVVFFLIVFLIPLIGS